MNIISPDVVAQVRHAWIADQQHPHRGRRNRALPDSERLSVPRLVRHLAASGRSAREAGSIDDIIATIVREQRAGDLVVIMSNGGFGGIHQKLLHALEP